jgi:hypothetical protein
MERTDWALLGGVFDQLMAATMLDASGREVCKPG